MVRLHARTILLGLVLLGAGPLAARPAAATPPAILAGAPAGSLAAMARLLPERPLGGEAGATVTYVDVATQLATIGVAPLRSGDEVSSAHIQATGWMKQLRWMGYSYEPAWREMFGFGLYDIDQAIEYEAGAFFLTIYRGRFSVSAVLRAWEQEGYRPIEESGRAVYYDLDVRLDPPGLDLELGNMSYAAILDDVTVAFASEGDVLAAALAASAGEAPSFADGANMAPLLAKLPANLVSAMIAAGDVLSDPAALAALDGAEVGRMPPVETALLGITAGAPLAESSSPPIALPPGVPAARPILALSFASQEEAERAAAVIAERLATERMPEPDDSPLGGHAGRPFAEMFPHVLVRPDADAPVVLVALGLADDVRPDILYRMQGWGALTIVAWSP
jgi:hypothetical protein